ncbi:MAG: hypothetical protein U9P36_02885, partial [Thermodesulfobacteriota bacterium]|nr:hypothetical protein [Thermodesulfobacteriota bacterium]
KNNCKYPVTIVPGIAVVNPGFKISICLNADTSHHISQRPKRYDNHEVDLFFRPIYNVNKPILNHFGLY